MSTKYEINCILSTGAEPGRVDGVSESHKFAVRSSPLVGGGQALPGRGGLHAARPVPADGLVQAKSSISSSAPSRRFRARAPRTSTPSSPARVDAAGFAGNLRFEVGTQVVTPDPEAMYGHAPGGQRLAAPIIRKIGRRRSSAISGYFASASSVMPGSCIRVIVKPASISVFT